MSWLVSGALPVLVPSVCAPALLLGTGLLLVWATPWLGLNSLAPRAAVGRGTRGLPRGLALLLPEQVKEALGARSELRFAASMPCSLVWLCGVGVEALRGRVAGRGLGHQLWWRKLLQLPPALTAICVMAVWRGLCACCLCLSLLFCSVFRSSCWCRSCLPMMLCVVFLLSVLVCA